MESAAAFCRMPDANHAFETGPGQRTHTPAREAKIRDNRWYPLRAMQRPPRKATRQRPTRNERVRISTAPLTDREAQGLKEFLVQDPNVVSVSVGPLDTTVERPKTLARSERWPITFFEIQAAVEPAALIVQLLKDNKDLIEALGGAVAIGTSAAIGARYVLNLIKRFCRTRRSMSLKVPIYDPNGDIIKWVRKKRK
jgi:hypothetical protein